MVACLWFTVWIDWRGTSPTFTIPSRRSTNRGVVVEFVKESLTFTGDDSAMSKLMLTIMGGVAEFEREGDDSGAAEGHCEGEEAGKYRGRKSTMTEAQVRTIRDRAAAGENKSALAREFGITRQTIYNLVATLGGYDDCESPHDNTWTVQHC